MNFLKSLTSNFGHSEDYMILWKYAFSARYIWGFTANFHKNSWTVSNQGPETVVANLLYDEKNDKLTSCEASLLDGEVAETKIDTQRAEVRYHKKNVPSRDFYIPIDKPE